MKLTTTPSRHGIVRLLASPVVVLVVLASIFVATPVRAEDVVPNDRVRSSVVVRRDPIGRPSPPVGALRPGDRATLLESVPYFFRIRLANGIEGYVSKSWSRRTGQDVAAFGPGRSLQVHFIDVGQGDSTLIVCPNGSTILADSGSTSGRSPDEVRQYLTDQINDLGGDIDYLFVSHPDADHYNLLREVLDDVPIGRAWYVGDRSDYGDAEVFNWLGATPGRATRLQADYYDRQASPNPEIDCGGAKVWILAAAVEHPESRKNAMSIVMMIRYGDFEVVVTGDATHATEDVILSRYPAAWLDIDVLRVGHHGSLATSTSVAWANALSPLAAIFSAGYQNTYGHPRGEVVDRLTPHTRTVPPHGFREWRANPGTGPRYVVSERPAETEAIYATSMNRTVVMTSTGSGFTTTLAQ